MSLSDVAAERKNGDTEREEGKLDDDDDDDDDDMDDNLSTNSNPSPPALFPTSTLRRK